MPGTCRVDAWAPGVPGLAEVLHARMVDYAYPPHCHDTWTVLIVDAGAIRYDLDLRPRDAFGTSVSVLPPGVVHDGGPAPGAHGFRKRNLYLEGAFLPERLVGAAVDHTAIDDPQLRAAIAGIHDTLVAEPNRGVSDRLDAEGRLAMVGERLVHHLSADLRPGPPPPAEPERPVADRLRLLLDEHTVDPITLRDAARLLDRSVPHLVRSFTRHHGVSPHAYVVGRRIEAARRLLLAGQRPAEVAVAVGFYDQAHLTRHFKRHTSTTPARYAAGHRRG
jgi:AraC-like DNA-binding protein